MSAQVRPTGKSSSGKYRLKSSSAPACPGFHTIGNLLCHPYSFPNGEGKAATGWKAILESNPVWVALGLIILGAIGMWHLYTAMKEEVERIAKEASKFPPDAIVAMGNEKCPDGWSEAIELRGHFILGAGKGDNAVETTARSHGGQPAVTLMMANLPPHRHQVYRHAGEVIGETSGIQGAGSNDPHSNSRVRESLSVLGEGLKTEPDQVKIMPPYVAYTFCRPPKKP